MGVSTLLTVASIGSQLAQGFSQYREEKKADQLARQRAESEAKLLEQDARRAAKEEREIADDTRRRQKVAFLSSGVLLEGSPLLVMEETRKKGEENARNTIRNAKSRADLVRQGAVSRANLFGTAASTAGNIFGSYSNYQQLKKAGA